MTATRPSLYVLDAFNLIFQVFHAIPEMTGPAGQPTQAVFGIYRDLLNLVRDRKPDYLAAAFDGPGRVFRSDIFEDYKATRKEMPVDLVPQIPVIRRVFDGFRVPVLVEPGMEADDLIATLTRRAEERGLDVFIVTADKDARQLISEQVSILNLRKNKLMDAVELEKEWGIRPDQVVDFLSLTGDTVDNVPGVPGIGEGFASTFLKQFGSLDNLLDNINQVKGPKKQQSLREHKETALRARELVRLRDDLPLALHWDALKTQSPDVDALKLLCTECGFHRFRDELGAQQGQLPLKEEPTWQATYSTVDTPGRFDDFLHDLKRQRRFCVDTETTAIDPLRADLVGLSFCWKSGEAYYLPLRGPGGSNLLDEAATLEALRPILGDPMIEKVGQNIKYDILALKRAGVSLHGPLTDTMVLSYLLESGERNHNLDQLSQRLLDHTMIPITDLIGKGKSQLRMDQVAVDRVAEYAGEDADATWRIETILSAKVRDQGLWTLYAELERPLIAVLAGMEAAGVQVDVERLKQLSREFAERIATIETEAFRLAGRTFNINSGPQLRQVLFDELKLPSLQKTPGGEQSTAQDVLEELALKHPFPALLLQHRQLSKLKSTYLDALPELVHPVDGRIHASFNQSVAATGRLSSSDPNLQNIPVRTEDGRQIRQAFIAGRPDAGGSSATAGLFGKSSCVSSPIIPMTIRRCAGHSPRTSISTRRWPRGSSMCTKMRSTIRCAGWPRRSISESSTGFPPTDSRAAWASPRPRRPRSSRRIFTNTPGSIASSPRSSSPRRRTAVSRRSPGRRRPINGIKSTTGRIRNLAERTAINTVIQGSAADLIKRAMILLDQNLREQGFEARMLLQIHR